MITLAKANITIPSKKDRRSFLISSVVVVALALGGCAPHLSMEDLVSEAIATGDWSKVNSRQDKLDREAEWQYNREYCKSYGKILICAGHQPDLARDCYCGTLEGW